MLKNPAQAFKDLRLLRRMRRELDRLIRLVEAGGSKLENIADQLENTANRVWCTACQTWHARIR